MQKLLRSVRSWLKTDGLKTDGTSLSTASSSLRSVVNWVLPHQLAVGKLPRPGDSVALAHANIQVVISLCAPAEGTLPGDVLDRFQCKRYILPDSNFMLSLSVEQLAHAVELIHCSIANHQIVYVHCLAGIQRSPTVCVAYLCRYHHMELWEAINHMRQVRRHMSLTDAHVRVVQTYLQRYGSQPLSA